MGPIAFLGSGAMGAPIAERLIDAGNKVRVFDPRAEAMAPLVRRGGITSLIKVIENWANVVVGGNESGEAPR
jgi:3-hydroxyisobutyrate dehydrogenase-like beta-hydroxyacid dehydrogenase